ncbi:hypothetical protein AAFF_G00325640 [Aldrovandia affinis]|uniref:Uncharacterized protein n=1 Tax=Aldrovandia affinis TaxID=143900 RepID=A0AAD7T960_9TELE|nr:hypothetical protein AAFF_G00325640 [Aldrovandia affinis]
MKNVQLGVNADGVSVGFLQPGLNQDESTLCCDITSCFSALHSSPVPITGRTSAWAEGRTRLRRPDACRARNSRAVRRAPPEWQPFLCRKIAIRDGDALSLVIYRRAGRANVLLKEPLSFWEQSIYATRNHLFLFRRLGITPDALSWEVEMHARGSIRTSIAFHRTLPFVLRRSKTRSPGSTEGSQDR